MIRPAVPRPRRPPALALSAVEPSRAPTPSRSRPPDRSPTPKCSGAPTGLTREGLTLAWADKVMPSLGGLAKAMYGVGRFLEVDGSTAVFALPNEAHRRKCEQKRPEVEAALSSHMGVPASLRLVVDDGRPGERPAGLSDPLAPGEHQSGPTDAEEDFGSIDVRALEDAPDRQDGVARLTAAFPGAELVQHEDPT